MGTEINWFEIYVMDLERAEFFYKKIFNATFFDMKDYPYEARGITLNQTPESMEGALVKHPSRKPSHDGLVKSQRHQLLEKFGCSERRVLKGTRVSNGLMTPKSDCILHPVDFLRVHQLLIP